MLRGAEIMLRLDEDEVKFRAVETPALQALGAGRENGELGLRHHP